MLHAIGVASHPSLLIACATSAHLSALRLEITTFAPARAIASAIARPMPLVEPVITATFPVRSNRAFAIHLPPFCRRGLRDRQDNFAMRLSFCQRSQRGDRVG